MQYNKSGSAQTAKQQVIQYI